MDSNTIQIQALLNLPMGLIGNVSNIKPEDYRNFNEIPNNALLIIDSEYLGIISSITKHNRIKFMVEHHSILPIDLRISNLRAQLNEFFVYNTVENEEIPVYIVGHKLWNIYKSIVDIVHVTSINSVNLPEVNEFFNSLIEQNFEKTISSHIPGNEIISDDPDVSLASIDYIIYEKIKSTDYNYQY